MMRGEQIKTERRRRNTDGLAGRRYRLWVNEAELDREKFEYRWANDEGNRLHDLTIQDDWEIVSDRSGKTRPDGTGAGAEIATPVGTGDQGRALRAVLLRKPKAYYNDDQREKSRAIDETEASLKSGAVPGAGTGERMYVPSASPIRIGHGDKP